MNRFATTSFVFVLTCSLTFNAVADSPPWRLMFEEAGRALGNKDTALALRYYERLVAAGEAGDLNHNARVNLANKLAMCYLELGKLDEAEAAIAQGAAITGRVHPNESNSLEMVRAEILIARGQFAEAEQKMVNLLKKKPHEFGSTLRDRANLLLGESLLKQQRGSEAKPVLEQVLKSRDRNLKKQATDWLKSVE